MAVRQYIGARYVPLYVGDWDATQNYEPLTIVTDANGNSFTSLKDVPAGTALTNREYWIQTSSFSGAVDTLTRRVSTVEGDVAQINIDLDELNAKIDSLKKDGRKFILMGDSFAGGIISSSATSDYGVVDYLCNAAPTVFYRSERIVAGNSGFASSRTFLSDLQNMPFTDEEKNKITDIVILAGTNDMSFLENVPSAIADFMAYVREHYGNATVKIGVIGTYAVQNEQIVNAYKTCILHGAEYISDGEHLFCDPKYISDGTHLTDAGYQFYLQNFAELYVRGKTKFKQIVIAEYDLIAGVSIVYPTNTTPSVAFVITEYECNLAPGQKIQFALTSAQLPAGGGRLSASPVTLPIVNTSKIKSAIFAPVYPYGVSGETYKQIALGGMYIDSEGYIRIQSTPGIFGLSWNTLSNLYINNADNAAVPL